MTHYSLLDKICGLSRAFKERLGKAEFDSARQFIKEHGIRSPIFACHIEPLWSVLVPTNTVGWLADTEALEATLKKVQTIPKAEQTEWEQCFGYAIENDIINKLADFQLIHDMCPAAFQYVDQWEVPTTDLEVIEAFCRWGCGDRISPFNLAVDSEDYGPIFDYAEGMDLAGYIKDAVPPTYARYNDVYSIFFIAANVCMPIETFKVMLSSTLRDRESVEWAHNYRDFLSEEDQLIAQELLNSALNNPAG